MQKLVRPVGLGNTIDRFRRLLTGVSLDCECKETLDGVLDRFTSLEQRRRQRSGLQQARRHRDMIASQLGFLAELDEITEGESDRSVFEEIAVLFDEIAASAVDAARLIRETKS